MKRVQSQEDSRRLRVLSIRGAPGAIRGTFEGLNLGLPFESNKFGDLLGVLGDVLGVVLGDPMMEILTSSREYQETRKIRTWLLGQVFNTYGLFLPKNLRVYWNVSKVTNMEAMFWGATSFNQPLNNFVERATHIFIYGAES